jgi:hypothetical protein
MTGDSNEAPGTYTMPAETLFATKLIAIRARAKTVMGYRLRKMQFARLFMMAGQYCCRFGPIDIMRNSACKTSFSQVGFEQASRLRTLEGWPVYLNAE